MTDNKKVKIIKPNINEKTLIPKLIEEKQEYLKVADHLMKEIDSILDSNLKLETEIEETQIKFKNLQKELFLIDDEIQNSENEKKNVLERLKRYENKVNKRNQGHQDMNLKITKLHEELSKFQTEMTQYSQRKDTEIDLINLIKEYDTTSKELIQMNKQLTQEVWRLFNLFKKSQIKLPDSVFPIIKYLREKMEKSERLRRKLAVFSPQDAQKIEITTDSLVSLDNKLKECLPLFNQLERLMTAPSRPGTEMSQNSSSWMLSDFDSNDSISNKLSSFLNSSKKNLHEPNDRNTQNPRISASIKKLRESISPNTNNRKSFSRQLI